MQHGLEEEEFELIENKFELIKAFNDLSEIPLSQLKESEALKRITVLGQQALRSQVCTLVLVDIENRTLTHAACTGFNPKFEQFMQGKVTSLGSSRKGYFVDLDLAKSGKTVEAYDLQNDGGGIANPKVARRYDFNAALCEPLKSEEGLIGYL